MTEVTDLEMGFSDDRTFRLDIRIGADSFDQLRLFMSGIFERCMNNAGTVKDLSRVAGFESVAIKFRDDKEARIRELRAEADTLEAELQIEVAKRAAPAELNLGDQ